MAPRPGLLQDAPLSTLINGLDSVVLSDPEISDATVPVVKIWAPKCIVMTKMACPVGIKTVLSFTEVSPGDNVKLAKISGHAEVRGTPLT